MCWRNLNETDQKCGCIRCREIRGQIILPEGLVLKTTVYHTMAAEEHFLEYQTPEGKIAGYLRLSLPKQPGQIWESELSRREFSAGQVDMAGMAKDLKGAALIREVHVYGQSLPVGGEQVGAAQHTGMGTRLMELAETIAAQKGYSRLVVIAAIGTRLYYENRGFKRGSHYMTKEVSID